MICRCPAKKRGQEADRVTEVRARKRHRLGRRELDRGGLYGIASHGVGVRRGLFVSPLLMSAVDRAGIGQRPSGSSPGVRPRTGRGRLGPEPAGVAPPRCIPRTARRVGRAGQRIPLGQGADVIRESGEKEAAAGRFSPPTYL